MTARDASAAALPPAGLPGLDPSWSRLVDVPGSGADAGVTRTWHVLDTLGELERLGAPVAGTILAVHGNPTWSYLWRSLLAASVAVAAAGQPAWRVVAVDQLEMGFSERTPVRRTLPQRVADLAGLTDALALEGPVVTLGHDWGGVVSLGWAVDHPERLVGVALLNTAIHHPEGVPIPAPLRLASARGVLAASTVATTAFLDTTLSLASPKLPRDVQDAYRAPYRSAARRHGIGQFVADIPASSADESRPELDRIAEGVAQLDAPALMLWGPADPIFSDRYLDDLVDRLPHADVHRFEGAGHLVAEDRPYAPAILEWLGPAPAAPARRAGAEGAASRRTDEAFSPLWANLDARATDDGVAVIDMAARGGSTRRVSWRQLHDRVLDLAAGLHELGVRRGDRVSLLVSPGPTLTAVIYACLRIGAVVVVADAGLGVKGLTRAVRGAWPDVIIGERLGLTAARALGWPGVRISAERLPRAAKAALGVSHSLGQVATLGAAMRSRGYAAPPEPSADDDAAILFTSGSTGPAKGVVYRHGQLSALRDVLARHLGITPETGLVTGFAPFALLGPALGTRSATPDMDVSAPRTLTATAVAAAVRESDARIVFLSPAAVRNVVETADALGPDERAALARVHTVLSAGAPIGEPLLASIAAVMPNATPHTPYGMTECLLVTDVTLDGTRAAASAPDAGVCVGAPIGDNRVLVSALDADGRATGEPSAEPGVLGEIVVSAPHLKDHYDRLWLTDRAATRDTEQLDAADGRRWHRTGDLGHLDAEGRVWVEGRTQHVIVTADGPVAPVGPEQDAESVDGVRRAGVVGVGPHGLRQAVAVVETIPSAAKPGLADPELAAAVRERSRVPLAAVLAVPQLPTDIRHNSKIDRSRLSAWAERVLAGERTGAP
ncbi:alpha/beta fold hydrolase [Agrococcus sp. HG114]|uniref:alpha/beta fold hydrolase n=1 Tax=Agrococcus sp. HG114 TaxID=2969757 RepID=UPI00215A8F2D|nr:alpha/beta fold hydrolase [Agrococcus sp. HG114]MCR8670434.1 alpha/beta fold hydrolase [Agrococcus sp. HG114]